MNALADSYTMFRRNLKHALRYPGLTLGILALPVILLLLFVFVLGDALNAGIGQGGRYVDYLTPGVVLMTVTAASMSAAIGVCNDLTQGIIARFRTMAIARNAVLTGRVVGTVVQTLIGVALVIGFAMILGFRPQADLVGWLAAAGLILLLAFGVTWMGVAMGILSKTPEGASNIVAPLLYLPFIGSSFVPPGAMSPGLRWFAEHQPFTPIIDTLRALMLGTPVGADGLWAVGWCLAMALGGYLWGRSTYRRRAGE
ncbi:transport permease protein [Actinorhabdospora filicis]|uniref:Transport permease protein n=1 Tax=Actinorhabdospora filicis TaxID=1785913 RepID=A0A9W6SRS0_9ACTN|nr:ABC transporter permease [Actinorhabdospora filicis]GLZ79556.1 transport permease protein [Actinorhabdospora filicis]